MKDFRIDYVLDGIAVGLGVAQINQVMQIIQLVFGIVATIISIAFSIYKWWKKASADGKITDEEIKDGIDIIKDHLDDKNEERDKNNDKI